MYKSSVVCPETTGVFLSGYPSEYRSSYDVAPSTASYTALIDIGRGTNLKPKPGFGPAAYRAATSVADIA